MNKSEDGQVIAWLLRVLDIDLDRHVAASRDSLNAICELFDMGLNIVVSLYLLKSDVQRPWLVSEISEGPCQRVFGTRLTQDISLLGIKDKLGFAGLLSRVLLFNRADLIYLLRRSLPLADSDLWFLWSLWLRNNLGQFVFRSRLSKQRHVGVLGHEVSWSFAWVSDLKHWERRLDPHLTLLAEVVIWPDCTLVPDTDDRVGIAAITSKLGVDNFGLLGSLFLEMLGQKFLVLRGAALGDFVAQDLLEVFKESIVESPRAIALLAR